MSADAINQTSNVATYHRVYTGCRTPHSILMAHSLTNLESGFYPNENFETGPTEGHLLIQESSLFSKRDIKDVKQFWSVLRTRSPERKICYLPM